MKRFFLVLMALLSFAISANAQRTPNAKYVQGSATTSATTTGDGVPLITKEWGAAQFDVIITSGTATVTFRHSLDGVTYTDILAENQANGSQAVSTSASGKFKVQSYGYVIAKITACSSCQVKVFGCQAVGFVSVKVGGSGAAGSDGELQRNSSGALGSVSGVTSDGTSITASSGNLRATLPRITTGLLDANGNPAIDIDATASALYGLRVTNAASGGTVYVKPKVSAQSSVTVTGTPMEISAGDAVPGSASGGADGLSLTIRAGNGATWDGSGNQNGGDLILQGGDRVGGFGRGRIVLKNGSNQAFDISPNGDLRGGGNGGALYIFGANLQGSSTQPIYSFVSNTTTGLGLGAAGSPSVISAGSEVARFSSSGIDVKTGAVLIRGVAFASLPATPVAGMQATVTDSNTATWGATVSGGGSNVVLAWYNGTNWTVVGK